MIEATISGAFPTQISLVGWLAGTRGGRSLGLDISLLFYTFSCHVVKPFMIVLSLREPLHLIPPARAL
ncbi:MAG: hypothetical protein NVSMB44_28760 [Ktedonobacteraceae bacterium]